MGSISSFEELDVWRKARALSHAIYAVTRRGAFCKDFPLRDQIRRAGISVLSNIAEGFERGGTKEFIQFLSLAKGSTGEIRAQLFIALDENYLSPDEHATLNASTVEVGKMIGGLMLYLSKTPIKGSKYK
jgi:four helix bundle protein